MNTDPVYRVGDVALGAVLYDDEPSTTQFALTIGLMMITISDTQISDLRQLLNDSEAGRSPEI